MPTPLPRSLTRELLDEVPPLATPDPHTYQRVAHNLRDIARYNRLLGANRLMLRLVKTLVPEGERNVRGLDVGIGAGDFLAAARRAWPSGGWAGADVSWPVLACARGELEHVPLCLADGRLLPFADGAFDVVTCAQTLHHLDEDGAVALLQDCARVARYGAVLCDLARSRWTVAGVWLLTRLTSRNRFTLADGVRSARRAYTPDEAIALARRAGLPNVVVRRHGPVRFSLIVQGGT